MYTLDRPDQSLELSYEKMQEMTEGTGKRILDFMRTLPDQPVFDFTGSAELANSLKETMPQVGEEDFNKLLSIIFDKALPKGINTPSPGFQAYIPVGGLFHSAIAEFITTALNRWPSLFDLSPGFVQLESNVILWLCEMMGMPKNSGGILTSGGSMANFSAFVTARMMKLPDNFLLGTIYTSDQAHHSVLKGAILAGFPKQNVRVIPSGKDFRISIPELEAHIKKDKATGFSPFLIVGNGGTTNTGAVDALEDLARIAKAENMWLHVDAAWAGAFRLTDHGKKLMKGIELADTITIDPHKALYLPYGVGALLAKDVGTLRKAHSVDAAYLPMKTEDIQSINFCNLSPELSRPLRGLQLWLPLKMHGIAPFKNYMQEKLDLTFWATEELRKISHLKIVAPPQLSVVAFRYENPEIEERKLDEANKRILEKINQSRKVLLSGTTLHGKFVIRLCPFAFRTHKEHVALALNAIKSSFEEYKSPPK